ncbi:MAG: hypothetical protein OEW45_09340 [Deltaproteobacteria bacterium]|nr:hypothetical protein [Deltaproteobacteria bacterium]
MCETDFESEYKEKTLDYELWIAKAEELLEVAGFLEPEIEKMWAEMREGGFLKEHYITTYFMLCSYALENLLKALYIKTNYQKIEAELKESCELPKSIKNHDLWKLAKELDVVEEEWGEETLLKKLTRSAVWFGRYPTPPNPKDLKRFHDSEYENTPTPIPFSSYMNTDLEEIRAIISRIKSKLNQNIP